jgi:hypothetical protein
VTQLAGSPAKDLFGARVRAYAIYLLTRQGTVTTPLVAALRETLQAPANGGPQGWAALWQQDATAALLAASYQLLQQDRTAEGLIAPLAGQLARAPESAAFEDYYDPLVRDGLTLYLLAKHFPARVRALQPKALAAIVRPLQAGRFNTLSAAYVALALDAVADALGSRAAEGLAIATVDRGGRETAVQTRGGLVARAALGPDPATLRFTAQGAAWYALVESGFDREPATTALADGIEVFREYLDAQGVAVGTVRLGDEVTVRLRIRATTRAEVPDVALVDLLPGGFEPVLVPPADERDAMQGAAAGAAPGAAGNAGATAAGSSGVSAGPPGSRLAGGGSWRLQHAEVREDRVVLYGSAGRDVTEFTYRLRATSAGRFTVPPAYAESLYERQLRARAPGTVIEVQAP